ncbi:MAG: cation diffusion facilitator family transporter [Moraxellaceae bacterium]|nr:cation diffusion facilitator family transporter [Pseudobdellovibrionaceae bacterium]
MSAKNESGSYRDIFLALLANLGIAVAKLVGAFFTKSASLLAEGIHSLADCANQVFLLIGAQKSKKPADELHPLGYGRETFFWSFLVALMLFSMGGLFAIYEGIHKLTAEATALQFPWVGLTILVLALGLESISFWACLKEIRKQNQEPNLWIWFQKSTASELIVIFIEDLAALVGLTLALIFLVISLITGNSMWDALGSVVIGILLVSVAFILAREVKSLLLGEKSSTDYKTFITQRLQLLDSGMYVLNILSVVTGSREVLLTMKVHPGKIADSYELIRIINALEEDIKKQFPEIRWLFVEPDLTD